tara:strand:- start:339 stop:1097 length:759 start_codon:yes stop_codon:yes gene_type:complete
MTLPASGNPISINSLVGEYGGSAPHSMSEYYKGGGLVANHSNNANVPTSGIIRLSDFHGQSNVNPIDNTYVINCGSATRGLIFGTGTNFGYANSTSYGGVGYPSMGSASDTSAQLGNNSTKRMLTGACATSQSDIKGNSFNSIELFFGAGSSGLTSGTSGFPTTPAGVQTLFSELAGAKLKVGGTQFAVFPSTIPGNGISGIQSSGLTDSLMSGVTSHKIQINSGHSSTGSSALSNAPSAFSGNNVQIVIQI